MSQPALSVVVPVFNERDNVAPLVGEITAALRGRVDFEIVYVDDDSRDDTLQVLRSLKAANPELRVLHHVSQSGQSTAVRTGVKAARGQQFRDVGRVAMAPAAEGGDPRPARGLHP
ncbi:glycosyltransferase family 2 protein, partial [Stenotrophomonas acidaminiphila]|uniref:glycosyltransferase family 2 protein n=1 Tax=Stenotrophomonas acidaminiphila TaxID=128780 RepID=UPI000AE0B054